MGFPIRNNYTILRALAFGEKERSHHEQREYQTILNSLIHFNLFAFVIHDPNQHQSFDQRLSSIFEYLDHTTGQKLLFFALTNPSGQWRRRAESRDYYRYLADYDNSEMDAILTAFKNPIKANNTTETAFTLTNSIGIPSEMLPVIIVTNDFRNKKFKWFRTSENSIERQLGELGYFAQYFRVEDELQELENFFNQRPEVFDNTAIESVHISNSLAEALSATLSFLVIANGRSHYTRIYDEALLHAKKTISTLQSILKEMKSSSQTADINVDLFDKLNIDIANFLGILNARSKSRLDSFLSIEQSYLENDSFNLLVTAQKVYELFLYPNETINKIIDKQEHYDYTPIGICLTKLFECEINLSMVHWIRQQLGIRLPHFFNKVDDAPKNFSYRPNGVNIPNPKPINFNQRKYNSDKWRAPGIGESRLCFWSMIKEGKYTINQSLFTNTQIDTLNLEWNKIVEFRNGCAHTEPISKIGVDNVIERLKKLNELKFFEKACQLKSIYRGLNINM